MYSLSLMKKCFVLFSQVICLQMLEFFEQLFSNLGWLATSLELLSNFETEINNFISNLRLRRKAELKKKKKKKKNNVQSTKISKILK